MARKKIQGITIEIGGDTTKLQTALKGVESKLKDTQNSLRDVNKLLKLDPSNTELLTQKQQLLGDSIKATEEKLKTLRDASDQAAEAMADGDDEAKAAYDALQREIIETEQQMKSLQGEMKEFGSVTAQQMKAAGEKVQEVGDKITTVGENLTKYITVPIAAVGTASVAAFNDVDEGLDTVAKKTGATGKALEDMQDRAMNLATTLPTDFQTAGEAVGEVATRFDLTGDALEKLSGQFVKFADLNNTDVSSSIDGVQSAMAAFGLGTEHAGNVLDILNKAAQDTGTDVNKLTGDLTTNAAALQEMGFRITAATGFLANLNKNGLDSSAVLTGMKKALQNATKNGMTMSQALSKMQKSILNAKNETEAMKIAMELFGAKSAPAMVKAIQDGRISFDEMANTIKKTGSSVDKTFEATLDPIDEFKMALNELKIVGMDLVTSAAPMIKQLAETLKTVIADVRAWWEGLDPLAQETIIKIAAIAAAVGPLLVVVGKVTTAVGGIMKFAPQLLNIISTVTSALSGLWGVLAANPITLIIAAIAALVGAFVYLWNTSEEFRQFWINLWEAVKDIAKKVGDWLVKSWGDIKNKASEIWKGLGDKISGIWDGLKSKAQSIWDGITGTIHNAIEKIKSFFNFQWELPKIKLPHFSIEGKFSLNPPQVPHLSIEWYRKAMENGMILSSPTILPAANGQMRGFGDAGPEAVVGVSSLREMITGAVANAKGVGNAARDVTVVLQLDKTELARTVVQLYNDESRRVGVRFTPSPI